MIQNIFRLLRIISIGIRCVGSTFAACDMNCVTLLSDFGLQDASVASAKGILMQHIPEAVLIDISHMAEPFHVQQAAYMLQNACRNFRAGTVHLILVDIFSERTPRLLLCEREGHFFLAPDNGILALAAGNDFDRVWLCYELSGPDHFPEWLHAAGRTAKELFAHGPDGLTLPQVTMKVTPERWQPVIYPGYVECHVIYIDRFGNVVLNLTRDLLESAGRGRNLTIQFMRDEEIRTISGNYSDVAHGQVLCRFNSLGYLEIAINGGNAARLLGLRLNKEQLVMYNTIKIRFE